MHGGGVYQKLVSFVTSLKAGRSTKVTAWAHQRSYQGPRVEHNNSDLAAKLQSGHARRWCGRGLGDDKNAGARLTCAHMLLVELRAVTTSVAFTAQFVRIIAE